MPSSDIKIRKREIFAWCLFDFANSSYVTVVITAIYPAFFVSYIAPSGKGDLLWGIAVAAANLLVAILSPFIGAYSDIRANKKKILIITTFLCVIPAAFLYFPLKGMVVFSMFLVITSFTAFSLTENVISSFLPEIAPKHKMGKISGYAWAFGYVGGMISLGACVIIIEKIGALDGVRVSMPVTAFFFLIPAIPVFILLKERSTVSIEYLQKKLVHYTWNRLVNTIKSTQESKSLFTFLISFFLFSCGVFVAITFSAIYAKEELGFGVKELLLLIIAINLLASLGAFLFGFLQDVIGAKQTVIITLIIWCLSIMGIFFSNSKLSFYICGALIGIALGSTQSASRAFIGILTDIERSGEDFGLWGFSGKLAAIVGSLTYGLTTYITQSRKLAVLVTLLFFISGLFVVLKVKVNSNKRKTY